MAGKAVGEGALHPGATYPRGGTMGQRLTRAYAEGRAQYPSAVNPHPATTPENIVWQYAFDNLGIPALKLETAVP